MWIYVSPRRRTYLFELSHVCHTKRPHFKTIFERDATGLSTTAQTCVLFCYFCAMYCVQRVCVYVCLSVCPLAYLTNYTSKFHRIFCTCSRGRERSSFDVDNGNTIRYVLPVLWMTSCFHITERITESETTRVR